MKTNEKKQICSSLSSHDFENMMRGSQYGKAFSNAGLSVIYKDLESMADKKNEHVFIDPTLIATEYQEVENMTEYFNGEYPINDDIEGLSSFVGWVEEDQISFIARIGEHNKQQNLNHKQINK